MVQAHLVYYGTVQGVGFRFTVQRFALSLHLTGWVKNLPNGSVEALIEGSKEAVEELCESIEEHFEGYIRDKKIQFTPALGQFKKFEVAY
jgi:acylphosphatase